MKKIKTKPEQKEVVASKKTNNGFNIENIESCPICKTWMTFCIAEPQAEDSKKIETWYREKQDFWDKNKDYLTTKGFTYESNIAKALDKVSVEKEDLDGVLLIVKIGSDECPAGKEDITQSREMINEILKDVKGVRVVVTHHRFNIEKVSLPQLRQVQSAILSSVDSKDDSNPMLKDLEV